MAKKLLLLLFWCLSFPLLKAQLPDPCPSNQEPAADLCSDACIYCDFNNYMGVTTGYTGQTPPGGFCGTIENEQWLGFIAGISGPATFTATPSNCQNGDGVQIALYPTCSAPAIGCNTGATGGGSNPVSITPTLVQGQNYYLLIDGFAGDICDFVITVTPPAAVLAPQVGPSGAIGGPSVVCPGATVTFTMPPTNGAGAYIWEGPPGATINGQPLPYEALNPGGNTVQITFPSPQTGTVQICATPINSCDEGNEVCKTVNVQAIPPTVIPPVVVCAEEAPYELPWGQLAYVSNNYQTTLQSWLGCDSVVRQQVTIKAPIVRTLAPQTLCAGNCITVCGIEFCDGGQYNEICESWQGCDSTVSFTLTVLDIDATILGGGQLSCTNSSVVLSSNTTAGTKVWKNPAGTVLGTGNSLTVTAPGTYILTVTASGSGNLCTESDTIMITGNTTPPTATAMGGTLGCASTSVNLTATTNATNPTYAWTGPGGFTSNAPSPSVSVPGTYTVVITNSTNGCTASATASVTGDTAVPSASATGGALSCSTTSVQITATSNLPNATFQWSGGVPAGPNATVTMAGTYTVTVTNPGNGCTSTATATVTLNNTPPGATATVSGPLSCTTTSVTLNATTTGAQPSYSWSGPGFTSNLPNPSVLLAGAYTVTVTSGANGCTSTASVTVNSDVVPPNVSAAGGTINCATPSINLAGSSTTPGATFAWTGTGFSSQLPNPSVNAAGTYTLTVTNPANGCTATATATVTGDFTAPNASATGGTISCAATSTTINAASTTPNVTYSWTGPGGFTSNQASNTVSTVGTYTVTVASANGCTATATATVAPDANVPNASASGGTLNCNITSLTLDGGSTTPGVTLGWTGPGGFTSNQEDPTVSTAGTYVLTVTSANGCSAQASANVVLDDAAPGATATGGTLTCAMTSFTLAGSSTSGNVTWSWTGPSFTSNLQNPAVMNPGDYVLVVTGQNGCTSSSTATVLADQNAPEVSSSTGILTCSQTDLVLNATSTLPATYVWTGPGGFSSTSASPTVTLPGDYTVTGTAANGCDDSATVTVDQDIAPPDAVTTGSTIDCNNPQTTISVTSATSGATFSWAGPGAFTSTLPDPSVTEPGTYTVTATGPNGCTATATATVADDTEAPTAQSQAADQLTCTTDSTVLQTTVSAGSSTVQSLAWTGPGGFTSTDEDPQVTEPGTYTLTVTSVNGCTTSATAAVSQDIAPPQASATGGTLTCTAPTLQLTGFSSTSGATYEWTGPGGVTYPEQNPSVSETGDFVLTVTGPNGCTATATATVTPDSNLPDVNAVSSNNLDCDETETTLTGSSATPGVTYEWSGPGGVIGATAEITVTAPGDYTLEVTASNGCTALASVSITQDLTTPGATALGDTIDCISGAATLSGDSPTGGVSWTWSGPNGFTSTDQNPQVSAAGVYTLTTTGPNGCTSEASATVEENVLSPDVALSGGGVLTCLVDSLTITATVNSPSGVTGVWTGPGGFTSTQATITVTAPGPYTFEATAPNGCVSNPVMTIAQDLEEPQDLETTGGELNCNSTTITLTAGSSTPNVTYTWTDPGGVEINEQNPAVSSAGTYILVVTNTANGCTSSATQEVTQDPTVPEISASTEILTCLVQEVTMDASTTTPNVTFAWTGPNGFTSTEEDPVVSVPGSYTVVATATSGCTASFNLAVDQDVATPGATAEGGIKTCTEPIVTLNGTSPGTDVTYLWSGPGGFTSNQPNPDVEVLGEYILTVTAPNGCTSTATATVVPDNSIPTVSMTAGTITCVIDSVQLTATTSSTQPTWSWTGPNGFTSTLQNPVAFAAGGYTVVVTDPTGCSASAAGTVEADTDGPDLSVALPSELNCTTTQVGLSVNVAQPGNYSFDWTTLDGTILSGQNGQSPQVSAAGLYTVVVTNNQNGCTSTEDVPVIADPAIPSGVGLTSRDVSCYGDTNGSVLIDSVQGGTPPFLYSFDGQPFSSTSTYAGLEPDVYSLVIQDANGCEYETTIEIAEPDELVVNLGPDTTLLLGHSINLSVDSSVVNIDPAQIMDLLISPAGVVDTVLTPYNSLKYLVTVVDSNGCKATDERLVLVDKTRHVYIPNVFDPESTQNNLFKIGLGIDVARVNKFLVYDRWGAAIAELSDLAPAEEVTIWDGTIKGKKATPAVFVYYAEILFIDGEVVQYKGDVTLQR